MSETPHPSADPFTVDGDEHEVGNDDCPDCWTGGPSRCGAEGCTGLVHNAFGDENADGDYWLYYKCDQCGATERP